MSGTIPILQLIGACPDPALSRLPPVPLELQLMPGECALIEALDPLQAADFADLCCGLLPPKHGCVHFLGRDWTRTSYELSSAMRGRIGRVCAAGTWINFLNTDANILLSQRHHTRRPDSKLRDAAAELSCCFGLPGLPLSPPDALVPIDLMRAACVRAFLGEPLLLLLESPEQGHVADLIPPLLNALAAAHDRHAATIWLTRSNVVWNNRSFPATARLRLAEHGLTPVQKRS